MAIRYEVLKGQGHLTGSGIDNDVFYELTDRSEDIPARHMGDPSAVVRGFTNDSITGRVNIVLGPGTRSEIGSNLGRR